MNISSIGNAPAPVAALEKTEGTRHASVAEQTNKPDEVSQTQASHQADSKAELSGAIKATNEFVGQINENLQFSVDDDTGKTIVKVIDTSTKEVIKQIPSEEMITIAKALDKLKGLLVQQKA